MNTKKRVVAMLLAGGQGSRLYALTKNVAKPAVPFGGKYRLIDFPLSNCTNAGIDTVGVASRHMIAIPDKRLNEAISDPGLRTLAKDVLELHQWGIGEESRCFQKRFRRSIQCRIPRGKGSF